ncbi:nucleotidyltransferase domain-containing protein [Bradyrhizobium sp. USDA 4504]
MSDDPLLARIIPVIAAVSGVAAIVLGGSRARGTAHDTSDTDIGLYYRGWRRAGYRSAARSCNGSGRRPRRCACHAGRRMGTVDRRRCLAHDRRPQGRPALPQHRSGLCCHRCLPERRDQHALPAGPSARLLLGDLDGRGRAVPSAARSRRPRRGAEGEDCALPAGPARCADPALSMGSPVQHRECRACSAARRRHACRRLRLSRAGLPRTGAVCAERAISDQRKERTGAGREFSGDGSRPCWPRRRGLAADRCDRACRRVADAARDTD